MSLPPPNPSTRRNVGVNQIARDTGYKPATVSLKMKRGMTGEQIRVQAKARREKQEQQGKAPKSPPSRASSPASSPIPSSAPSPYTPQRKWGNTTAIPVPPTMPTAIIPPTPARPILRSSVVPSDSQLDAEFDNLSPSLSPSSATGLTNQERFEEMENAKLRRARALAEEKELQNAVKRNELIPVLYVRTWGTRFLREAKDFALQVPSTLQDELAAEVRPGKVHEILTREMRRLIGKLFKLEELWVVAVPAVPATGVTADESDESVEGGG